MMMLLRPNSFIFLSAILLLSGCGDSGRDVSEEALKSMVGGELKDTVSVSGMVRVGGEPGRRVTIFAYTKESGRKPAAECLTKSDGTYCWNTYTECDGLPPGDYRLAFKQAASARQKPGAPDKLGGKYMNPNEIEFPLKVELGKPQTDVNYDL